MSFHRNQTGEDIHALTAGTYADTAARDADTDFQVSGNLNKLVRVNSSPVNYFVLTSLSPTVWSDLVSTATADTAVYAQLSSTVDQEPGVSTPVVITYNTQDSINGITHSTSVDAGELTIVTAGIYTISPQPQVGKDTGGAKVDFDMFVQVDRGAGFVDEDNSNIRLTIKDSDITDVIVSTFNISLDVGDIIRMMQRVSSTGVGMGLKTLAAEVGPPSIPLTPSVIFSIHRSGGV